MDNTVAATPQPFPTLHDKTLIMLVGPASAGKTTVIRAAERLDTSFSFVQSFTTRKQRDLTDTSYMFLPFEEAQALRDSNQTVTCIEHPTTHDLYGTLEISFRTEYCLLDTLFNSVNTYTSLPFSRTTSISITTPVQKWVAYFLSRFPQESEEGKKRLEEARLSIQWSLAQSSDHAWIVNDSTPEDAAKKLIAIARSGSKGDNGTEHAAAILHTIEQGIW